MKYHYTILRYLPAILRDGIQPAQQVPLGVRPIVWLTTSDRWEETCNKGLRHKETGEEFTLTRDETAAISGGLARIGVSDRVKTHPWFRLMRLSRESKQTIAVLRRTAEACGSNPVRDWYGTFQTISPDYFEAVDWFRDGSWVSLNSLVELKRKESGATR